MLTVEVSEEVAGRHLFYGLHAIFKRAQLFNFARVGLSHGRFDAELVLGKLDTRGSPDRRLLANIGEVLKRVEVELGTLRLMVFLGQLGMRFGLS